MKYISSSQSEKTMARNRNQRILEARLDSPQTKPQTDQKSLSRSNMLCRVDGRGQTADIHGQETGLSSSIAELNSLQINQSPGIIYPQGNYNPNHPQIIKFLSKYKEFYAR